MDRFNVSWDTAKVGDVKKMLELLKEGVPEYAGWSLAALGGTLLARAVREELKKRGINRQVPKV